MIKDVGAEDEEDAEIAIVLDLDLDPEVEAEDKVEKEIESCQFSYRTKPGLFFPPTRFQEFLSKKF